MKNVVIIILLVISILFGCDNSISQYKNLPSTNFNIEGSNIGVIIVDSEVNVRVSPGGTYEKLGNLSPNNPHPFFGIFDWRSVDYSLEENVHVWYNVRGGWVWDNGYSEVYLKIKDDWYIHVTNLYGTDVYSDFTNSSTNFWSL